MLSVLLVCLTATLIVTASIELGGPSYRVATVSTPQGVSFLALLSGRLAGQTRPDGSACFWIDNDGTRVALIWPQGYSAKSSPLRIIDQRGATVAVAGQSLGIGGGTAPDGFATKSLAECSGTGRAWLVGDVAPS